MLIRLRAVEEIELRSSKESWDSARPPGPEPDFVRLSNIRYAPCLFVRQQTNTLSRSSIEDGGETLERAGINQSGVTYGRTMSMRKEEG